MIQNTNPLSGLSILVTRPEHQADMFCLMLEQAGAKVYRFPVMAIESTTADDRFHHLFNHLAQQDIVIFTSSNAVRYALPWLKPYLESAQTQLTATLPCSVAAIGKKTAQALQDAQIDVQLMPERHFNSESLLALPEMQTIKHKKILIIKGEGGRTLLRESLLAREANVEEIAVYRRVLPTYNNLMLKTLRSKKIDIITLTSVESSNNLMTLLHHQSIPWLSSATLVLGSPRIEQAIEKTHKKSSIGSKKTQPVWIAKNPSDDAMFTALLKWKEIH